MRALIIGGNRFFGRELAGRLLDDGIEVTILNRGTLDDGYGDRVKRIVCDRLETQTLKETAGSDDWDVIYDQVCFDYRAARAACEVFAGRAARYVFTSSQSVYGPGGGLAEDDFVSSTEVANSVGTSENYAEAKRQAESAFASEVRMPVVIARLPIVLGMADYTGRLDFHIERIAHRRAIYFPKIDARISFARSEFVAEALAAMATKFPVGPINVAGPGPIALCRLVAIVEEVVGQEAVLALSATEDNHSPYGIDNDWYMNCDRLAGLGLVDQEIEEWLPDLVRQRHATMTR